MSLEQGYDPAPYESVMSELTISASDTTRIDLSDHVIRIDGNREFLKNLALNLPIGDFEKNYHIHYDWISFPQYLSKGDPDIVLEAVV